MKDLQKANELIQKLEEIGAPALLVARLKAWVENQASNMPWDKTPYLDGAIHRGLCCSQCPSSGRKTL
jgi:hypothetical protein